MFNTSGMSAENTYRAEKEPEIALLQDFVTNRASADPLESYDELQQVLRGESGVIDALADFVKRHGSFKVNGRGEDGIYFGGRADKYNITAWLNEPGTDEENVVISSSRRTLPLMRYKSTKLVTLHTQSGDWDQAVIYRPQFNAHMPRVASPDHISFWANMGTQPVYTDNGDAPSTSALQIALEASSGALETINGFLDTTVWLTDHLLQVDRS